MFSLKTFSPWGIEFSSLENPNHRGRFVVCYIEMKIFIIFQSFLGCFSISPWFFSNSCCRNFILCGKSVFHLSFFTSLSIFPSLIVCFNPIEHKSATLLQYETFSPWGIQFSTPDCAIYHGRCVFIDLRHFFYG